MLAVFDHHKRRYGTRRVPVELRGKGYWVGRQALRTGLRRHHRRALQPKAFAPRTTDSTHGQRGALNLLLDQSRPTQAESLWSHLKTEGLEARDWSVFADLADAQISVAE